MAQPVNVVECRSITGLPTIRGETVDWSAPDGLALLPLVSSRWLPAWTSHSASNPYPTTLGGVKLNIGGVDAQLAFVGTGQISFVVPSNVPTGGTQTGYRNRNQR